MSSDEEGVSWADHFKAILEERDIRYEQHFTERDRRYEQRYAAQDKAVTTALASNEKRLDQMNEIRGQLQDQANTFIPRGEHAAVVDRLTQDIQDLKDRINSSSGEAKGSQLTKGNYYAALAAVGGILGIVVLLANNVFK